MKKFILTLIAIFSFLISFSQEKLYDVNPHYFVRDYEYFQLIYAHPIDSTGLILTTKKSSGKVNTFYIEFDLENKTYKRNELDIPFADVMKNTYASFVRVNDTIYRLRTKSKKNITVFYKDVFNKSSFINAETPFYNVDKHFYKISSSKFYNGKISMLVDPELYEFDTNFELINATDNGFAKYYEKESYQASQFQEVISNLPKIDQDKLIIDHKVNTYTTYQKYILFSNFIIGDNKYYIAQLQYTIDSGSSRLYNSLLLIKTNNGKIVWTQYIEQANRFYDNNYLTFDIVNENIVIHSNDHEDFFSNNEYNNNKYNNNNKYFYLSRSNFLYVDYIIDSKTGEFTRKLVK